MANLFKTSFDIFLAQSVNGRIHSAVAFLRKTYYCHPLEIRGYFRRAFNNHHQPFSTATNANHTTGFDYFVEPAMKEFGRELSVVLHGASRVQRPVVLQTQAQL